MGMQRQTLNIITHLSASRLSTLTLILPSCRAPPSATSSLLSSIWPTEGGRSSPSFKGRPRPPHAVVCKNFEGAIINPFSINPWSKLRLRRVSVTCHWNFVLINSGDPVKCQPGRYNSGLGTTITELTRFPQQMARPFNVIA